MTGDCYVYVLFDESAVPFYVGKGTGDRWMNHEWNVQRGRSLKDDIISDMLDAGLEIPKIKVAEGLSHETAYQYERAFIAAIGRHPHGFLVNVTDGGVGAGIISEETRQKLRRAAKGKRKSESHRRKIGESRRKSAAVKLAAQREGIRRRGIPRPPDVRAKISLAHSRKKLSPAHRANISAAMKGRQFTQSHRDNLAAASHRVAQQKRERQCV